MTDSKQQYQVLLADDDRAFRETLRGVLEPYYQLFEAESGEHAVEIVESERVDAALLDMHMHRMTGLEAIRAIKDLCEVIPCILVTGDATDELRRDAVEVDAYSVLSKPVRRTELVAAVMTALEEAYELR